MIHPHNGLQPTNLAEKEASLPEIEVSQIVGEGREAVLIHQDTRYRLRITAQNKLILTK